MAVGEGPSRELLGRRVMTTAFSGMSLGDSGFPGGLVPEPRTEKGQGA